MPSDFPAPVADYFAADAAGDLDALVRSFVEDGAVKDEGELHRGAGPIRAWWRAAKAKYRHEVAPLSAATEGDRVIVSGLVTGDFPGSPATLRFAFDLSSDGIRRLEIGA